MQAIFSSPGRFARTLGVRTELIVNASRTQLEERDRFAIVSTPQNPGYYLGNYLLYDGAPAATDVDRWANDFDEAFARCPQVRHAAFVFDAGGGLGTSAAFRTAGFTLEEHCVMRAERIAGFAPPAPVTVRAFSTAADWAAQMDLQMATRPEMHDEADYRRFKERQIAHHRDACERFGLWLGAFDGRRLTGSCGIFNTGEGVARYQDVAVHPEYRNRGIARSLICAAGSFALEKMGVTDLVIVAKRDDFPRRIYLKCGFTDYQREAALWKARRD